MRASRRTVVSRALLAVFASCLIAAAVYAAIGQRSLISLGASDVQLLAPSWLYLLMALPAFAWVTSTFSLTGTSKPHRALALAVRMMLWISLVAALSRPVSNLSSSDESVVVLVDVSASVSDDALGSAYDYAEKVKKAKQSGDTIRFVTFADAPRATEIDGPGDIKRHELAEESDLEAALKLAYGLFPGGTLPHAVLISDGQETRGSLMREAARANKLGVRVSTVTLPGSETDEVRIDDFSAPDEVSVGRPFELRVKVWSTHADNVILKLTQNGRPNALEPDKHGGVAAGENWFTFKAQSDQLGPSRYEVQIVAPARDTEQKNNTSTRVVNIVGRPQVLVVDGDLTKNPEGMRYFKRALEAESILVQMRSPRGLPTRTEAYAPYDLVVLSDVGSEFVGSAQSAALESYVQKGGGGLLMAGGERSFGSGGYQGTRMEAMMPVRFDGERVRQQARVAIALVIDRSGSMMGKKLEAAKASARATARVLTNFDMLEVIAFDQKPITLVRMQRASNRAKISSDISRLKAGGGTDLGPALAQAHQDLLATDAKVKHVVVLSDGHAPFSGIGERVREMRSDRITVSAVGIGDADRSLLQMIVDHGEGRLTMTRDLASLPRIFMQETTEAQKNILVESRSRVKVAKRVAMIEGSGVENAPALRGHVSVKAKPRGEVILVSDQGDPLLARSTFGLGSVVAWTSDIKNRWAVDWLRWPGFQKFWAQVVRATMKSKAFETYDIDVRGEGDDFEVVVNAIDGNDRFVNGLTSELSVIDPLTKKVIERVLMNQDAPGRYVARLGFKRYGSFLLKAEHRRDGRKVAVSHGSATRPYPREFSSLGTDAVLLGKVAELTGGTADLRPEDAFGSGDRTIETKRHLWPWLLLLAMGLWVIDVYLKRLRLFGFNA